MRHEFYCLQQQPERLIPNNERILDWRQARRENLLLLILFWHCWSCSCPNPTTLDWMKSIHETYSKAHVLSATLPVLQPDKSWFSSRQSLNVLFVFVTRPIWRSQLHWQDFRNIPFTVMCDKESSLSGSFKNWVVAQSWFERLKRHRQVSGCSASEEAVNALIWWCRPYQWRS